MKERRIFTSVLKLATQREIAKNKWEWSMQLTLAVVTVWWESTLRMSPAQLQALTWSSNTPPMSLFNSVASKLRVLPMSVLGLTRLTSHTCFPSNGIGALTLLLYARDISSMLIHHFSTSYIRIATVLPLRTLWQTSLYIHTGSHSKKTAPTAINCGSSTG